MVFLSTGVYEEMVAEFFKIFFFYPYTFTFNTLSWKQIIEKEK